MAGIDKLHPDNNKDWILDESIIPTHWHDKDFLFVEEPGCDEIKELSQQQATAMARENSDIKSLLEVEHEVDGPTKVSRRHLLAGGLAATGLGMLLAADPLTPRYSYAATRNNNRLVFVFLRGGWDGLTVFPAFGDANYYKLRPNIGVQTADLYKLNETIGMHKGLAGLKPLWDAGEMALVHGCGLPDSSRSHFNAQDSVERAAPTNMRSGFLGRYLALNSSNTGTARAITFGSTSVLSLATNTGGSDTLAMSSVDALEFTAWGWDKGYYTSLLKSMYSGNGAEIQGQAEKTFTALNELAHVRAKKYAPAGGIVYSTTPFGKGMQEIARMIKANVGMEVACIDYGGWDHHQGQGKSSETNTDIYRKMSDLADTLGKFRNDLGAEEWDKTTVVLISEFGRRAYENGTGTDHGTAGAQVFLGGKIRGGIHGRWPGLAEANLTDGALSVATDFRHPMADILKKSFGVSDEQIPTIFPGFTPSTFNITE